jgi:hypothetical protein
MADGAPTELEIVLAVGLQRCRADGALIFENGFDARPHPGLLPRGEGESFAGFVELSCGEMAGAAASKLETDDAIPSLGRG